MKLAGLSPSIERDKMIFAQKMGMRPKGKEIVERMTGGRSALQELSDNGLAEDDRGPLAKWREPMKGLERLELAERLGCYLNWLEYGRTLLNFPLITNKRTVYSELNCLLAHVQAKVID